jgi:hypothetical protein
MLAALVSLAAIAALPVAAVLVAAARDASGSERRRVLALALAVRALVGAGLWTWLGLGGTRFLFDEADYFHRAAAVGRGGPLDTEAYLNALGLVFEVTGPSLLLARGLSLLAGALVAVAAYELTARLAGRRAGLWAGAAVALWPSLVAWSVVLGKDSLVVLALVCALLAVSRAHDGRWLAVPAAGVALLVVELMRPWAYALAAIAVAAGAALLVWRARRRAVPVAAALVVVVGCVGLVDRVGFLGLGYTARNLGLGSVAAVYRDSAKGETGFDRPAPESLGDVLVYLPQGIANSVLGPLPWKPGSPAGRALMVFELPVWYAALALGLVGLVRVLPGPRAPGWLTAVAFTVMVLGVLAIYMSNAGTALRMRAMVIPVVVAVVAARHGPRAAPGELLRTRLQRLRTSSGRGTSSRQANGRSRRRTVSATRAPDQ